ncbi:MAG: Fic family protein [Xanthobacteraceae bacterium]
MLLHAENTVIPDQVVVYSSKGANNNLALPFDTSLYDLRERQPPHAANLIVKDGQRLFTPTATLAKVPENFFARYPVECQVVLTAIKDPSEILGGLLEGGHSTIAGRLAGAFRRLGRSEIADEIIKTMKAAGYTMRETDPFAPQQTLTTLRTGVAPIVGRIQALWNSLREPVIQAFPHAPGLPKDTKAYLGFVDEIYASDAYHSLSIEGYRVTPELIDRVRAGNWNPKTHKADRESGDALAARGYWQAFQSVKQVVRKIIAGANAGALVRTAYRDWYRELFQPCVAAGLMDTSALAGHRNHPVYLKGSRHVPPRWEVLPDAMGTLFDLLEGESEPSVRAVLGHWLFGYIHPYPDGNGRMARFVMNAMLASGGYSWTVIRVEDRDAYMRALESASVDADIRPFAAFIAERVRWSMAQSASGRF